MKNKKFFLIIAVVLILIVGLISVFGNTKQNEVIQCTGDCSTCQKKTCENHVDKSSWLENVGLSADASDEEITSYKKSSCGKNSGDYLAGWKEKLGLAEDASDEEVKEAIMEWKSEDKKGCGCGKS